MKQLTNSFAGLELGQEQLPSSLKNVGAMAHYGLQMASNLVDSREQFFETMESHYKELVEQLKITVSVDNYVHGSDVTETLKCLGFPAIPICRAKRSPRFYQVEAIKCTPAAARSGCETADI